MEMKIIILVFSTICVATVVSAKGLNIEWKKFKLQYNKSYKSTKEEVKAFTSFIKTLKDLQELKNEVNSSFVRGINSLADMNYEDFVRRNTLQVLSSQIKYKNLDLPEWLLDDTKPLPPSVDWSLNLARVSPVKDQGDCGSCWAFATTGLLEGQEYCNLTGSKVTPLSEQQLIDCDGAELACEGGNMGNAILYVKSHGLESEKDYPYQYVKFPCSYNATKTYFTTKKIKEPKFLPMGDEDTLQKVVARYGPVAVGMDASLKSFHQYKSGVYKDPRCSQEPYGLTHAVLVVGYGADEKHGDYWLVKNSWGTGWGMSGYFKLARNQDNQCGVATAATIAL